MEKKTTHRVAQVWQTGLVVIVAELVEELVEFALEKFNEMRGDDEKGGEYIYQVQQKKTRTKRLPPPVVVRKKRGKK